MFILCLSIVYPMFIYCVSYVIYGCKGVEGGRWKGGQSDCSEMEERREPNDSRMGKI